MSKTVEEIAQAHKRTIEAYTGKSCTIIITDKEDAVLKKATLAELLTCVEKHNETIFAIGSDSIDRRVVKLRKIFCLLAAKAGYSAKKTGAFLNNRDHTTILYSLRTGRSLLSVDDGFKKLYLHVLQKTIQHINKAG